MIVDGHLWQVKQKLSECFEIGDMSMVFTSSLVWQWTEDHQPPPLPCANFSLSWALRGPCCVHPRHPVLHFEWVNVPGHVVTNDETSSPPLCRSCSLIPNMHLTNYYETEWINLLDVRNWWKRLSKNNYLDDSAHKLLMIPHTNFEMFDDSAHKFWRMIVQVQH